MAPHALALLVPVADPRAGHRLPAPPQRRASCREVLVGGFEQAGGLGRGDAAASSATPSTEPARARAAVQMYRVFNLRELLADHARPLRAAAADGADPALFGDDDFVLRPELLAGYERHADEMEVELVPGCGHFIADEMPGPGRRARPRVLRAGAECGRPLVRYGRKDCRNPQARIRASSRSRSRSIWRIVALRRRSAAAQLEQDLALDPDQLAAQARRSRRAAARGRPSPGPRRRAPPGTSGSGPGRGRAGAAAATRRPAPRSRSRRSGRAPPGPPPSAPPPLRRSSAAAPPGAACGSRRAARAPGRPG